MCAVRGGTGYVAATDDDEAISRRCGLENGVKAVSPWETSSERSAARWVLPGLSANMCQASLARRVVGIGLAGAPHVVDEGRVVVAEGQRRATRKRRAS